MLYNFSYLFLIFFIYSVVGYLIEITSCSITEKKLVINRGFLIGPYLPIYGSSVLIMYIFLGKYVGDVITLFVMSCFICSLMEFFTSYILEKIYKVRWWDYTNKKFNIDGRICLENSLLFGLGGLILFYIFNPLILPVLNLISKNNLIVIAIIIEIIFLIDVIISIRILTKLRVSSYKFSLADATAEIIELRNKQIHKDSFLLKRLLNAFPKVEGKYKNQLIDLKKRVNEIRNKIK